MKIFDNMIVLLHDIVLVKYCLSKNDKIRGLI